MTDTPKRVYLDQDVEEGDGMFPRCFENPKYCGEPAVEYHRADLSADLVRAALERAAETSKEIADQYVGYMSRVEQAIRNTAKDDEAVEAIITSVLGEPTCHNSK